MAPSECPRAKHVWTHLGFSSRPNFSSLPLHAWVLEFGRGQDIVCFIAALWWLWKSRCALAIAGEDWPLHKVLISISSTLADIPRVYGYSHDLNRQPKEIKCECPPPPRFFKLNVCWIWRVRNS